MTTDELVDSLRRAVEAAPTDVALRVHLAELLLARGRAADAVQQGATALQHDPLHEGARRVVVAAAAAQDAPGATTPDPAPDPVRGAAPGALPDTAADPNLPRAGEPAGGFDWGQAEEQLGDVVGPPFTVGADDAAGGGLPDAPAWDVERSRVTLDDVAGMDDVKARLDAAFLAPLRNPQLRRLFRKSLRGGLLLYGPPGCGKTFLARAVAGELGAKFMTVGLAEILDMYLGNSEQNVHEVFQLARREAPCVLFLDELDALGQKRSMTRNSGMRGAVVQLLTELDGAESVNDGVFVLAATNQPWDVDPALRRPGRLDRTVLVLPPDRAARVGVFRHHLRDRPVEGIDLERLARMTDGYSGADIAYVCETATEAVLLEGARTGDVRLIRMADLEAAVKDVRPSTGPWMETARNVVLFGDEAGTYGDLRDYLRKSKRL
ncbi:ATP-binding protein [Thalassiella azotivora]